MTTKAAVTPKPETTQPAPIEATSLQVIGYEARKRALELVYRQEAPITDTLVRANDLASFMLLGTTTAKSKP